MTVLIVYPCCEHCWCCTDKAKGHTKPCHCQEEVTAT